MAELQNLLKKAITASIEAGKEIIRIYHSEEFGITHKDDRSPLTVADKNSHKVIVEKLGADFPILSEEGKKIDYSTRKEWDVFWLIDPLDGTKEFIKRNGEFTVNIALINKDTPVLGVIYVPVTGVLYFSISEAGAYKNKMNINEEVFDIEKIIKSASLLPSVDLNNNFTVVASRSHMSDETRSYITQLEKKHQKIDMVSVGSSLKLCMVAEGNANVYPRFAPTMEWDTGAGHAIIKGAGKEVIDYNTKAPMKYNKENLLNNWFIAQ